MTSDGSRQGTGGSLRAAGFALIVFPCLAVLVWLALAVAVASEVLGWSGATLPVAIMVVPAVLFGALQVAVALTGFLGRRPAFAVSPRQRRGLAAAWIVSAAWLLLCIVFAVIILLAALGVSFPSTTIATAAIVILSVVCVVAFVWLVAEWVLARRASSPLSCRHSGE